MDIIVFALLAFLQLYSIVLLIRVLLTWIPNLDYSNPLVRLLFDVTEPVLKPIRNALPPMSGFDLSPLVVFVGIMVLQNLLPRLLL